MNGFIVSATESGGGKTLITAGLMKALSEIGNVKPFKAGPDYIDPMFHRFVLGKPSYNLDLIICGKDRTRYLFYSKLKDSDIAVIEGVMGLYDGTIWNGKNDGSTADLALELNLPILLIVDGRGKSRSIAALVKGFLEFETKDKRPKFAGIIINRIKNEHVYGLLKGYIEENCEVEVLGWIPEDFEFHIESRHLGLLMPEEILDLKEKISRMTEVVKRNVDLKKLLKITQKTSIPRDYSKEKILDDHKDAYNGLRIAVAYDKAFNFYYQDNLDLLEWLGVELIPFSPLVDKRLPDNIDALYLGGGYPEVFAEALSVNQEMMENVKKRLNSGLPCYAECGGQIYLSQSVQYQNTITKQAGVLPLKSEMKDRLQHFGYARLETQGLFERKFRLSVHEFHRSVLKSHKDYTRHFYLKKYENTWTDGGIYKNTFFGYPHIHFYASPDGPELLINILDYLNNRRSYDYC